MAAFLTLTILGKWEHASETTVQRDASCGAIYGTSAQIWLILTDFCVLLWQRAQ